jgi:hypothetical protein
MKNNDKTIEFLPAKTGNNVCIYIYLCIEYSVC